jgi:Tol biopolymer transport system component
MNGFFLKTAFMSCVFFLLSWQAAAGGFEVVYSSCRGGGWDLWKIDAVELEPERLTDTRDVEESDPRWFYGGGKIAFSDNMGRIGILDMIAGETFFLSLPQGKYAHPVVWPGEEDRLVFTSLITVPADDSDIAMVRFKGNNVSSVTPLVVRGGMETFPAASPDGHELAYVYWEEEKPRSPMYGTVAEIWIRDVEKGEDRQITHLEADSFAPAWSPDGRTIAFASNKYGSYDIWTVSSRGGEAVNVTRHMAKDSSPTWAPDGEHLIFVSTRTGLPQLWMIELGTGNLTQLTNDGCAVRDPHCSGDWKVKPEKGSKP